MIPQTERNNMDILLGVALFVLIMITVFSETQA
jgi:hypothetical protein